MLAPLSRLSQANPLRFGQTWKLLMVEDYASLRVALLEYFSRMQTPSGDMFEVHEAQSARQAQEMMQANGPFDVIFSDNSVPYKGDGLKLLALARKQAAQTGRSVFTTLYTADSDFDEVKLQALAEGTHLVLQKPEIRWTKTFMNTVATFFSNPKVT